MLDLIEWLRSTIEADKAAAEAVSDPAEISMGAEYVDHCGSDEAAEHIRRHDIQDTIARCKAELAELAALEEMPHYSLDLHEEYGCQKAWAILGECDVIPDCSCGRDAFVDRMIRIKACGYQHRPGFDPTRVLDPAELAAIFAGAAERLKLPAKPDDMEALKARLTTLKAEGGHDVG